LFTDITGRPALQNFVLLLFRIILYNMPFKYVQLNVLKKNWLSLLLN